MSHFYIVLFYKVHTAKHIFAVLLALLVGMWLTLTHAIGILLYYNDLLFIGTTSFGAEVCGCIMCRA